LGLASFSSAFFHEMGTLQRLRSSLTDRLDRTLNLFEIIPEKEKKKGEIKEENKGKNKEKQEKSGVGKWFYYDYSAKEESTSNLKSDESKVKVDLQGLKALLHAGLESNKPIEEIYESTVNALLTNPEDREHIEWVVLSGISIEIYEKIFQKVLTNTQTLSRNVIYLETLYSSSFEIFWEIFQNAPYAIYSRLLRVLKRDVLSDTSNNFSLFGLLQGLISIPGNIYHNRPLHQLQHFHKARFDHAKELKSTEATLLGFLYYQGNGAFESMENDTVKATLDGFVGNLNSFLSAIVNESEINKGKIKDILQEITEKNKKVGSGITNEAIVKKLSQTRQLITKYDVILSHAIAKTSPPPFLLRIFPQTVLGLTLSYFAYQQIAGRSLDIQEWLRDNQIILNNLIKEWILKPVREIYSTIRYNEPRLALMRPDELEVELKSLRNMVLDYANDQKYNQNTILKITENSLKGDISLVMTNYQTELRNPIKNLIFGDMLRLILIQIQSAKVDVATALSSLDKIMRANELNFTVLSLFPTAYLLGFTYYKVVGWLPNSHRRSRNKIFNDIAIHLRSIHMLLNKMEPAISSGSQRNWKNAEQQGLLITEISLLHSEVKYLSEIEKNMLNEDLADLENTNLTLQQRLETIQRIYNSFPLKPQSD